MPQWIRCLHTWAADGGAMYERVMRAAAIRGRAGIVALLSVVLASFGSLAGCGQRGPLTLPNRDAVATPVSEASPVSEAGSVPSAAPGSAAETQVESEEQASDDDDQESDAEENQEPAP